MGKGAKGRETGTSDAAPVTPMALWVGRARAAGALLGFAAGLWVCHRQGLGLADSTLRALLAAAGFSLVAWWSALLAIQGLMRAAAAQRERERQTAAAEAAAAAASADPSAIRRAAETVPAPSAEASGAVPEAG
jgi:hypothetical protein